MKKSAKKTANLLELAVMVFILAGLGFLGWRFYPQIRAWTHTKAEEIPRSAPIHTETPSLKPRPHGTTAGGPTAKDTPGFVAEPPRTTILKPQ